MPLRKGRHKKTTDSPVDSTTPPVIPETANDEPEGVTLDTPTEAQRSLTLDPAGAASDFEAASKSLNDESERVAAIADELPRRRGRPRIHPEGTTRPRSRVPSSSGRRLTRDEMAAQIATMEKELKGYRAQSETQIDPATLSAPLTAAFGVSFKVVGRLTGIREIEVTPEEAAELATAWAPIMAPLLVKHADKLPWIMAGLATVNVFAPKLEAYSARKAIEERTKVDVTATTVEGAVTT